MPKVESVPVLSYERMDGKARGIELEIFTVMSPRQLRKLLLYSDEVMVSEWRYKTGDEGVGVLGQRVNLPSKVRMHTVPRQAPANPLHHSALKRPCAG